MKRHRYGFTLVELVVVIVVTGVLAGGMILYFKPALMNYAAVARRAGLANQADGAVRSMVTEIRTAVPNSLRLIHSQCLELIPTSDGGRFRTAPDIVWDAANPAAPSRAIDTADLTSEFDVLTDFNTKPSQGDWVVIGNQNGNDVYEGSNRAEIAESAELAGTPMNTLGRHRIRLTAAKQFPVGYEGGRFVIVPNATKAVSYVCDGDGLDANGTGKGTLYRVSNYGFNDSPACPAVAAAAVVAIKLESCTFIYDPSQGATQQSGFVDIRLTLTEESEKVSLSFGAHVGNVP